MKKLLLVVLIACLAGNASAAFVSPLWEGTATPFGDIGIAANWPGGVVPFGSSTGLISSTTLSSWETDSALHDIRVRLAGTGILTVPGNAPTPTDPVTNGEEFAMRGGTTSGLTTLVEVAGDAGALNLNVGKLTMWSQFGGNMTLDVISGGVEASELNLISSSNGAINMLDGNLHAISSATADAQFNMLTGGTGNITIDGVENNVFNVNFETGNLGSFTLGSKFGGVAGGVWEFAVANGFISIDGLATTAASSFSITSTGGNDSTIALVPEPTSVLLLSLGGVLLMAGRRRTSPH